MRFTVTWAPTARRALTLIYNDALDQKAVTDAANKIDSELKNDADKKGAPFNGRRVLVCLPLMVAFKVDPGDCMVKVLKVVRVPG